MKKYLFLIAATCALLSCAKEGFQESTAPDYVLSDNGANGKIISFSVEVEPSSETKATISSNTNFTWEGSDRAAVYTSDGTTKVELTPTEIEGGKATFTGEVPSGKTVAEGAIVVYPASFLTGPSSITFPDSYGDAAETKGQGTVLAAKVKNGKDLRFKYLAATLKATITDVPSVATAIIVESTQVLTGDHNINFDGDTPSLTTTSEAKTISFSSPAEGNNVLVVPIPKTGTEQTITFSVKYNESNLFTKSTIKTPLRNTYLSMADLTIAPSVYLVSDMTSWTDGEKVPMIQAGTDASFTINAVAGKHWRPIVVYPTGFWVFYGFTGSDSDATSGTFDDVTAVPEGKMSALVNASAGNYTLSFNYVTGAYRSSSTGAIADFQIGDVSHGNLQNMTKLSSTLAYNVRQWGNNGGTLYAYYNNDYSASRGGDYYVSSENYYLWVYNFSTNTLVASWFDNNTAGNWEYINLKGSFDGWTTGIYMTNISGTPAWFANVEWNSETEFGFYAKGPDWGPAWQGNGNDPVTDHISDYCPSVSKNGSNYKVGGGKYTIIFYENNKFAILNRD